MLDVLRYLSICLPVMLLLRLFQQGLWKVSPYGAFAVFLGVGLARDLVLLVPGYTTHLFTQLWEVTLPVLLLSQIGAGVSTYRAIASLYPKIGRFAAWLFGACLLAACAAGLALLPLEVKRIGAAEAELRVLFLVQRWVATLLAGGLTLAVLFLARFPAPLRRMPTNIGVHTICIAVYFTSYAILYTLENTKALGGVAWAEVAQLGLVVLMYGIWTMKLSAAGQVSERWPELDPEVGEMLDARYKAAVCALRQAAGEGRK